MALGVGKLKNISKTIRIDNGDGTYTELNPLEQRTSKKLYKSARGKLMGRLIRERQFRNDLINRITFLRESANEEDPTILEQISETEAQLQQIEDQISRTQAALATTIRAKKKLKEADKLIKQIKVTTGLKQLPKNKKEITLAALKVSTGASQLIRIPIVGSIINWLFDKGVMVLVIVVLLCCIFTMMILYAAISVLNDPGQTIEFATRCPDADQTCISNLLLEHAGRSATPQ